MKKALLLCMALAFTLGLSAQKQIVWFDAGLKAQYGFTGLYNSAIVDNAEVDYIISKGYGIGGKIGINFGYNGISIDVMRNKGTQEFDLSSMADTDGSPTLELSTTDIYLLYRNARNLGYFEIGPKVSFLNKAEFASDNSENADVKENFKSNGMAGVIGFGANIMGNDGRFSGILGLRFEYGFTDVVNETGQANNAPINYPDLYADGYKSSNPIFAGVVFELNWGLGYFGKSQCGGRSKFIMF